MISKRRMAPAALLAWFLLSSWTVVAQDASKIELNIRKLDARGIVPEQRHAAMRELIEAGKAAAPALCGLIESADRPFVKHTAAATLREILRHPENRDEALLPRLEAMVLSKDPALSAVGPTVAMEYRGSRRARDILKKAAKRQSEERLRAGLMDALAYNMRDEKSDIPFLAEFLKDRSDFVRIAAAEALGKLGDKSGAKLCEEILNRKPSNEMVKLLQLRAAAAAYSIREPELIPALKRIASSHEHGKASSVATRAIEETEFSNIDDKEKKLQYLKDALARNDTFRWALMRLTLMQGAGSKKMLEEAANNRNGTIAREAKWLLQFRGVREKK